MSAAHRPGPRAARLQTDRQAAAAAGGRRRSRRKVMAICGLAALATAGLAGSGAADYGGFAALRAPPAETAQQPAGPSGGSAGDRTRIPRLAASQGSPFSFLESLFGLGERRAAPRPRAPVHRTAPRNARPDPVPPPASQTPPQPEPIPTYRTLCVRLCDGYYWPVSFSTSKDNFARDERACTRSCGAPVALYYYPNPGGELEEMVSLQGTPYKSLDTAFLHRTTYDPSCKCRAHPWETEAIERHRAYAGTGKVQAAAKGGGRRR